MGLPLPKCPESSKENETSFQPPAQSAKAVSEAKNPVKMGAYVQLLVLMTATDAGQSPPPESPVDTQQGDRVPRHYQKVEIEYSKFGVEDFDFAFVSYSFPAPLSYNWFRFYNKTPFSGLETHILNSYTNSLIQAMHYVLPLRRIAKSHITTPCAREYCLLCELGFVMRMLEDAKGINCQATNFCKTIPNLQSGSSG